jgi:hypothetical protein
MKEKNNTYNIRTIHVSSKFDNLASLLHLPPEFLAFRILEHVADQPEKLCLVSDSPAGLPRVLRFGS